MWLCPKDGRLITRAVSFKAEARRHETTESCAVCIGRCRIGSRSSRRWRRAGAAACAGPPAERRRVAIVMANYPNRDGRLANGVGLDTPAGVVRTLQALAEAGMASPICPLIWLN